MSAFAIWQLLTGMWWQWLGQVWPGPRFWMEE